MGDLCENCCPECKAGKHRNCDGKAWDYEKDDFMACPCFCQEDVNA